MNVPASTISAHSAWYSASEPSTQWIADGLQRSAILSIQRIRCVLVVSAWCEDTFEDLFMSYPRAVAAPGNDRTSARGRNALVHIDHIIDRTLPISRMGCC